MSRSGTDARPVRATSVLADAVSVYRRHFRLVAVSAIPLFTVVGLMGLVLHAAEERLHEEIAGTELVPLLLFVLLASLIRSLGTVLYAGFLDELVGAELDGRPLPSLRAAIKDLPVGRLIVADVIVSVVVGVGAALAVVPGLVAFTFLGIVGPIINIERRTVIEGIRRSITLVSTRFWTAAVLLVPLLLLEHAAETWFVLSVQGTPLLASIGLGVGLGLTAGAGLALIEVVLAHRLMRADRGGEPARAT